MTENYDYNRPSQGGEEIHRPRRAARYADMEEGQAVPQGGAVEASTPAAEAPGEATARYYAAGTRRTYRGQNTSAQAGDAWQEQGGEASDAEAEQPLSTPVYTGVYRARTARRAESAPPSQPDGGVGHGGGEEPPAGGRRREADYGEEDEEPRSHAGLWIILGTLCMLLLLFAAIYFLPSFMDRPQSYSGFSGALFELHDQTAGVVDDLLKKTGLKKDITVTSFRTANNVATTGSQLQFTITTSDAVDSVRVENARGDALPGTVRCMDEETQKTYVVSVQFDTAYSGDVVASLLYDGTWHASSSALPLQIISAVTPVPEGATPVPPEGTQPTATVRTQQLPAGDTVTTFTPIPTATAVPTPTPTPEVTATPTKTPRKTKTPKPTATPEPTSTPLPLLTMSSTEGTAPTALSLTETVYRDDSRITTLTRSKPIRVPSPEQYTIYQGGVFAFRGDSFRRNAAFGTAEITQEKMTVVWSYPLGSLRTQDSGTLYGVGWTGQPAIIKWPKEYRETVMKINDEKRGVNALKEVIFGAMDGKIYFLDLNDGQPTRDAIELGYPIKSSVAVHSYGYPMLSVGQAISRLSGQNGTKPIGFYLYSLVDNSQLLFLNGRKHKGHEQQYQTNGAFDGSALFDQTSDTMMIAGENGLIYTLELNTDFQLEAGTLKITPSTVLKRYQAKGEGENVGIEASMAMYSQYLYTADTYGIVQCVDTDSMQTVWAVDAGDNTDATLMLDFDRNNDLGLYTGTTVYKRTRSGKKAVIRRLNALTGAEIWRYEIACNYDGDQLSGCKASPLAGENEIADLVIFTVNKTGSENRSTVIAFDEVTGEKRWEYTINACAVSSPVAVYTAKGGAYVIQADESGKLHMLQGTTGKLLSTLDLGGSIQASPAVYNNMLVIGTCSKGNAAMYGIRLE